MLAPQWRAESAEHGRGAGEVAQFAFVDTPDVQTELARLVFEDDKRATAGLHADPDEPAPVVGQHDVVMDGTGAPDPYRRGPDPAVRRARPRVRVGRGRGGVRPDDRDDAGDIEGRRDRLAAGALVGGRLVEQDHARRGHMVLLPGGEAERYAGPTSAGAVRRTRAAGGDGSAAVRCRNYRPGRTPGPGPPSGCRGAR